MIKTIVAFVTRRPTMAVALSSLEKTLAHLDAIVVHQTAKSEKANARYVRARKDEDAAVAASLHAKRVSDRLAALLA